MIWYYAEDTFYYKDREFTRDKVVLPEEKDLRELIRENKIKGGVLASYLPPEDLKPLFRVVFLSNRHGILTTQDVEYLNSIKDETLRKKEEEKIIEEKVGLKIYRTKNIKLEGLSSIKRFIMSVKEIKDPKLKPKGIFLVGLPGTGKSFSAKFASSVLDAYLVEFNLSKVLESNNPVFVLHSIFKYLENVSRETNERFILWIDEIEKMFTGEDREKRVFGQMLTIMNDLNTDTGYQINGFFWVTANNIVDIMKRNPEFLRKGRFDELFFIDNPLIEDAKKMSLYYKNYYGFTYKNILKNVDSYHTDVIEITNNIGYVIETMETGSKQAERFIYVPAEIQQIAKQMSFRDYVNRAFLQEREKRREITKMLYPLPTKQVIGNYLDTNYQIDTRGDYEKYIQKMENIHLEFLTKAGDSKTTDLDLVAVISMMNPLALSMKDAISVMRSQEKIFTKGD